MNRSALTRFSLHFPDAETEQQFQQLHQNPRETRIIFIISISFYMLYIALDFFLFPGFVVKLILVRLLFFLPIVIVLFALTYVKNYYRMATPILVTLAASSSIGVLWMEYIVRDSPYAWLFFFGAAQIMVMFFGIGRTNVIPSAVTGLSVITAAIVVDTVFVETDYRSTLIKMVYLITMGGMGLSICGIIQFKARQNFWSMRRVEEISITDTLTGLHNRRYFQRDIEGEVLNYARKYPSAEHQRYERATEWPLDRQYGVILLDLDKFKIVNDMYGHAAGDLVLVEFTRRIRSIIRNTDAFIRWGGEEFLLILRNTHIDFINKFSVMMQREISSKPFDIGKAELRVTASGGVILIPVHSEENLRDFGPLIRLVDMALYHAKENGRNRISLATPVGSIQEEKVSFSFLPR